MYDNDSIPVAVLKMTSKHHNTIVLVGRELSLVWASKRYEEAQKQSDDKHTGNFKHFEHYSEEDLEEEDSEYAKLLQDEDGARKAIIMSEILNRKY